MSVTPGGVVRPLAQCLDPDSPAAERCLAADTQRAGISVKRRLRPRAYLLVVHARDLRSGGLDEPWTDSAPGIAKLPGREREVGGEAQRRFQIGCRGRVDCTRLCHTCS